MPFPFLKVVDIATIRADSLNKWLLLLSTGTANKERVLDGKGISFPFHSKCHHRTIGQLELREFVPSDKEIAPCKGSTVIFCVDMRHEHPFPSESYRMASTNYYHIGDKASHTSYQHKEHSQ